MTDNIVIVYCTCETEEQAKKIGKVIVNERLAACANIIPKMHSIYWWNKELEESEETILLFKTAQSQFENLQKRIKELHTYQVPCIIALPIVLGNPDYLFWILKETQTSL